MMEETPIWYNQHSKRSNNSRLNDLERKLEELIKRFEVLERKVSVLLHDHHSDGGPS